MFELTAACGQLLRYFFPNYCRVCTSLLKTNSLLCPSCYANLPWNNHACLTCALPLSQGQQCGACLLDPLSTNICLSPFIYQPPISNLITQLKFQHQLWCSRLLGRLLASAIQQRYQNLALPECIIPIPLHAKRLRQRGFNQALEIAKPLAAQLNIPLLYNYYSRHKNTEPQSQLTAAVRRRNMSAAFSSRRLPSAKYIAILDDVMTTGQTVREFKKVLLQQGIPKIDIWSCARAI